MTCILFIENDINVFIGNSVIFDRFFFDETLIFHFYLSNLKNSRTHERSSDRVERSDILCPLR
ncbi:hypothetical protein PPNK14_09070 [Pectobacterium parmentieri]